MNVSCSLQAPRTAKALTISDARAGSPGCNCNYSSVVTEKTLPGFRRKWLLEYTGFQPPLFGRLPVFSIQAAVEPLVPAERTLRPLILNGDTSIQSRSFSFAIKTEMERSRAMSNASSSPALLPYNHNFTDEDLNDILGATLMEDAKAVEEAPGSTNSGAEDDEEEDSGKVQARSERKRSREKQRRSDVNKQFADLTQLLRRIESEEEGRTVVPMSSASATNRVDLIARTITTMQRTHELCKKRKVEIESLQKQLEESHKMTEDTAARLKEATLYQQPGLQKQVCTRLSTKALLDSFRYFLDSFLFLIHSL
jgi:hypothetical protein